MRDDIVDRREIVPLLGAEFKRQGQWLMFFCPCHPDGAKHGMRDGRSAGLSDEGVLRCFAGCSFKDLYNALKERAGVREPISLSSERTSRRSVVLRNATTAIKSKSDPRSKTLIATYDYRDHDGKLVAQKARFTYDDNGMKTFRWRMPGVASWDDETGLPEGMMENMPLWGADELAKVSMDEWVFVVEGEKAAQACRSHGLVAVTHGGGASTRKFGTSLEVLRGRNVALWPDNDEAGRRYMNRLGVELRGIAKVLRVISVPVPEKGDAHDYFASGHLPEDVFKLQWDKPLVEFLSDDHIKVTVYCDIGPIVFDFEEIEQVGKLDLSAELTICPAVPGFEAEPYSIRVNILSASQREGLERNCKKQFGDAPWTALVSQAISRAKVGFQNRDRGMLMGSIPEVEKLQYLIDGILPKGQPAIVFGNGSSGKTMWVYMAGLSVAMGVGFWGMDVEQGGVLIVDYETNGITARWRMNRLITGLGIDKTFMVDLPIHYWPARGVPLSDQIDAIRRYIKKHDISMVIVDSGGTAVADPPETSRAALGYFTALERLGDVTSLTICHVSHASDGMYPFGSVFWHNLARRTYYMRADGIGTDTIDLAFVPRKCNDDKRPKPMAFRLDFTAGEGGPIAVTLEDIRDVPAFDGEMPVTDRIYATLVLNPGLKLHEIAEETGIPIGAVKTALSRDGGTKFKRDLDKGIYVWRAVS
jgi:hypothetical protein